MYSLFIYNGLIYKKSFGKSNRKRPVNLLGGCHELYGLNVTSTHTKCEACLIEYTFSMEMIYTGWSEHIQPAHPVNSCCLQGIITYLSSIPGVLHVNHCGIKASNIYNISAPYFLVALLWEGTLVIVISWWPGSPTLNFLKRIQSQQ